MSINEKIVYAFDCPEHGEEIVAFCFRAFEEANKDRWRKYLVTYTPAPWAENELEDILAYLMATGRKR